LAGNARGGYAVLMPSDTIGVSVCFYWALTAPVERIRRHPGGTIDMNTATQALDRLKALRTYGGAARSSGLNDATVLRFAAHDADLIEAIHAAADAFETLRGGEFDALLRADEASQLAAVHADYVNFYADD